MPRQNLSTASVVALAGRLADDEGFDAVSISAVARRAGVQPASLYGHVRDLAALRDALHVAALGELGELLAQAVAGRSDWAALGGLTDAHRSYARERPGMWAALQRPASAEVADSAEAQRVATLMLGVLRGYSLDEQAAVHATRFVAATITGFIALDRADAFAHRPTATDASWAALVDAVDRALRTWP